MDFKLDLKLQNEVDLSISKNEQVVFTTHQTDSMFILTFDLKKGGYGRKEINIEINEDGSRMTISGEKPNIRGFQKTFIIPEEVALDKINARFDQQESRLTIRMPKLVRGMVTGSGIQEFKHSIPNKGITPAADEQTENHDVDEEIKQQELKPESHAEEAEKSSSSLSSSTTIIVGSTLLVSLIVVFFGFIRSKNESTRKTS